MRKFIVLFLAVAAAAQQQGDRPTFSSTTRLVIVNVSVRDRSGKPIEGLTASDFQLSEDGKPQKISVFEFQRLEEQVPRRDFVLVGDRLVTDDPSRRGEEVDRRLRRSQEVQLEGAAPDLRILQQLRNLAVILEVLLLRGDGDFLLVGGEQAEVVAVKGDALLRLDREFDQQPLAVVVAVGVLVGRNGIDLRAAVFHDGTPLIQDAALCGTGKDGQRDGSYDSDKYAFHRKYCKASMIAAR